MDTTKIFIFAEIVSANATFPLSAVALSFHTQKESLFPAKMKTTMQHFRLKSAKILKLGYFFDRETYFVVLKAFSDF